MRYLAEKVTRDYGTGISIRCGDSRFEQISARDGLIVRLFSDQHGKTETEYTGIIKKPSLKDTEEDYNLFKSLTDRIKQLTGTKIENSETDYMSYISHDGFENKSSRFTVRYNVEDLTELPPETQSFLNKRNNLSGFIGGLGIYTLGLGIVASNSSVIIIPSLAYISSVITIEGLGGLIPQLFKSDNKWCGPMFAPGYLMSKVVNDSRVSDCSFPIEQFMANYNKLNAMEGISNKKEFTRLSMRLDTYYGMIKELFPHTVYQKGFSISFSDSEDHIVRSFSKMLNSSLTVK